MARRNTSPEAPNLAFKTEKEHQSKSFRDEAKDLLDARNDTSSELEKRLIKAEVKSERMKTVIETVGAIAASAGLLDHAASRINTIEVSDPKRSEQLANIKKQAEDLRKKAASIKDKVDTAIEALNLSPENKQLIKQLASDRMKPYEAAEQKYLRAEKKKKQEKSESNTSPLHLAEDAFTKAQELIEGDSKAGALLKKRKEWFDSTIRSARLLATNIESLSEDDKSFRLRHIERMAKSMEDIVRASEYRVQDTPSEYEKKDIFQKKPDAVAKQDTPGIFEKVGNSLKRRLGYEVDDSRFEGEQSKRTKEEQYAARYHSQVEARIEAMKSLTFDRGFPPKATQDQLDSLPVPRGFDHQRVAGYFMSRQNPDEVSALASEEFVIPESIDAKRSEVRLKKAEIEEKEANSSMPNYFVARAEKKELAKLQAELDKLLAEKKSVIEKRQRLRNLQWASEQVTLVNRAQRKELLVGLICDEVIENADTFNLIIKQQNLAANPEEKELLTNELFQDLLALGAGEQVLAMLRRLGAAGVEEAQAEELLGMTFTYRVGEKIAQAAEKAETKDLEDYKKATDAFGEALYSTITTANYAPKLVASQVIFTFLESTPGSFVLPEVKETIATIVGGDQDAADQVLDFLTAQRDIIAPLAKELNQHIEQPEDELIPEGYAENLPILQKALQDMGPLLEIDDIYAQEPYDYIVNQIKDLRADTAPSADIQKDIMNRGIELASYLQASKQEIPINIYNLLLSTFNYLPTYGKPAFEQADKPIDSDALSSHIETFVDQLEDAIHPDVLAPTNPASAELRSLVTVLRDLQDELSTESPKLLATQKRILLDTCIQIYEIGLMKNWNGSKDPDEHKQHLFEIADTLGLKYIARNRPPLAGITHGMETLQILKNECIPAINAAKVELTASAPDKPYAQDTLEKIQKFLSKLKEPTDIDGLDNSNKKYLQQLLTEYAQICMEYGLAGWGIKDSDSSKMLNAIAKTFDIADEILEGLTNFAKQVRGNEGVNSPDSEPLYQGAAEELLNTFNRFSTLTEYQSFKQASEDLLADYEAQVRVSTDRSAPTGSPALKREVLSTAIALFEKAHGKPFEQTEQSKQLAGWKEIDDMVHALSLEAFTTIHESPELNAKLVNTLTAFDDSERFFIAQNPEYEAAIMSIMDSYRQKIIDEANSADPPKNYDVYYIESSEAVRAHIIKEDRKNLNEHVKKLETELESLFFSPIPSFATTPIDTNRLLPSLKASLDQVINSSREEFHNISYGTKAEFDANYKQVKRRYIDFVDNLVITNEQKLDKYKQEAKQEIETLLANPVTEKGAISVDASTLEPKQQKSLERLTQDIRNDFEATDPVPVDNYSEKIEALKKRFRNGVADIYARDKAQKEVLELKVQDKEKKKKNKKEKITIPLIKAQKKYTAALKSILSERFGKRGKKKQKPFLTEISDFEARHNLSATEVQELLDSPNEKREFALDAINLLQEVADIGKDELRTHPQFSKLQDYFNALGANIDDYLGGPPSSPSTPPSPPENPGGGSSPQPEAGSNEPSPSSEQSTEAAGVSTRTERGVAPDQRQPRRPTLEEALAQIPTSDRKKPGDDDDNTPAPATSAELEQPVRRRNSRTVVTE